MTTTIDLAGRVAVVTGAGGGLGRSHALALAARGADVVVNDLGVARDGSEAGQRAADAVVVEIEAAGGRAVANRDSVADPVGARAIVAAAVERFGRLDIVVNNAGILRDATLHKLAVDDLDAVLAVHLRGTVLVSRAALPVMREQGYGRFVHTASAAGLFGNFGQSNYGAAKAGIAGFSRTLALEGAKHGITSNAIAPMAQTRMTEELLGPLAGRLDPELVSPLVVFLCSDTCELTGETFTAGGGRYARVVTGFGAGWLAEGKVTPDDIADHLADIREIDDLVVPASTTDEILGLAERLGISLPGDS
ncbi:SDR family NAD(P)-dependent oxidoreductase [Nitriliruptor alkaliphilus]|uniref:SDR family NAD(P)-dependent oxidoreductase n=1 Tax=Nitriliruptor alkaliphilus TaxID=427918 RepID=UPI000A75FD4E|nr:SDR family NAD(P)-dependent oxidoreductase [Nitriliruptor alkaliphilus]